MGEHSKPEVGRVVSALRWVVANKGKIAAALLVVLPLVARYVPNFPTDEAVSVVRLFLGAA